MELVDLKKLELPDSPGVYYFRNSERDILYIGKATSLKDRVRSYFSATVITRGQHIEEMVKIADTVTYERTDSVLEALILESAKIKQYQPPFNSREKDNKSYNYVVATNEAFPRIFTIRQRALLAEGSRMYLHAWGPFPHGSSLEEALKILRKILPFRDKCVPLVGKPCFHRQIGLCPGVCDGSVTTTKYKKTIRHIALFFQGNKTKLIKELTSSMQKAAKEEKFEEAAQYKKEIFSLTHINDTNLIGKEVREQSAISALSTFRRIEAYDVAHLQGSHMVGVMVVVGGGVPHKSEYRTFNVRGFTKANDPGALREILLRRFQHSEWEYPDLIVVDGNKVQRGVAENIVKELELRSIVVAVTKDERHRAKTIEGDPSVVLRLSASILLANAEAHRFSIKHHRLKRDRVPKKL